MAVIKPIQLFIAFIQSTKIWLSSGQPAMLAGEQVPSIVAI